MTNGSHERCSKPDYGIEREFGVVPSFTYRNQTIEAGGLAEAVRGMQLTFDYNALNLFLRADLFLNGATPFREVRRVSPPPVIVPAAEMSREQAIDGYIDLFRQAVTRRRSPGSVVALSGGRDSRHILLELCRQGAPPAYALTIRSKTDTDFEMAHQLARAVGVEHRMAWQDRSIDGMRFTVRATDFMSMEHAWFADVARARDERPWWDGIGGDVLSAGNYPSAGSYPEEWDVRLFDNGQLDELAHRLVRTGRVPYFRDQSLFPRPAAVEAVRKELALHIGAANPAGSFYFWNRTRVNIGASAFGLLRRAGQVICAPFLDRDLWHFLSSIPLRHILGKQLHNDVLRRAYPAFAHLEYSRKRRPDRAYHQSQSLRLLRHLATQRPTRATLAAAARTVRTLVFPWRASDIHWITSSWIYGDELERVRR